MILCFLSLLRFWTSLSLLVVNSSHFVLASRIKWELRFELDSTSELRTSKSETRNYEVAQPISWSQVSLSRTSTRTSNLVFELVFGRVPVRNTVKQSEEPESTRPWKGSGQSLEARDKTKDWEDERAEALRRSQGTRGESTRSTSRTHGPDTIFLAGLRQPRARLLQHEPLNY